jgi:hypothetical protein
MEFKSFMEALKGKQHKIDKNKNGEVDAHDFKLLRKEETEELEEATVKTQKYEGGKVMTVHHGASHSYPLHPEHQEAIRNLKHGEKTSFKDETGAKVNVHRDVQDVHFTSNKTSTKTTVPYSHFSEEVEIEEGNGYDDNRHGFRKPPREDDEYHVPDPVRKPQAPVAPVPDKKYIKGTPENKALKASRKPINGMPTNTNEEVEQMNEGGINDLPSRGMFGTDTKGHYGVYRNSGPGDTKLKIVSKHKTIDSASKQVDKLRKKSGKDNHYYGHLSAHQPEQGKIPKHFHEEVEQIEERNKQNALMRKNMDASRGARYKLNNPVPDADPKHKTARDHNVAIGRALRSEAHMTTTKDKSGKLVSFKYEGDWKKSTEKKQGSGKAANLAGQGMQTMAKSQDLARARKNNMMTDEVEHIHELNDNLHPAGAALLKHIKPQHHNLYKPHLAKDTFNGSYKDRTDVLTAAKKAGHLEEAKDEQEYGYEGDMALNQLATLTRCAEMIKEMLKPDTDMPEWVQSKITLATDYIQTAADYMHSEMNEGKSVDIDKVNVAGDAPHEEKFETFKKTKRVKESFDDEGNLISNKISYKDFITEIKLADLPSRKIQGRSYGADYSDPEGADDYDDKKPIKPAAEKRGRGRPAGAKSGARKITGTSKLINK